MNLQTNLCLLLGLLGLILQNVVGKVVTNEENNFVNNEIMEISEKLKGISKLNLGSIESSKDRINNVMMNDINSHNENEMLNDEAGAGVAEIYRKLIEKLDNLDTQIDKIDKNTNKILQNLTILDCSDLEDGSSSGEYHFQLDHEGKRPVKVWCDQDTEGGGWTVIQQRKPKEKGSEPFLDFDRKWYDYRIGFGTPSDDYWIGLENIYIWTNTRHYELRIELTSFEDDNAYAHYKEFYIESEKNNYKLHVAGYEGDAKDSLSGENREGFDDGYTANGMEFSTKDRDNDKSESVNCAERWATGGWWYNRCSWANLNGKYIFPDDKVDEDLKGIGINWHKWKNSNYMKSTVMKIRPTKIN